MKNLLAVLLLISSRVMAEVECSFDVEHQKSIVKQAATKIPNGKVGSDPTEAIWEYQNGRRISFSYGGCADLGSTVTLSEPMKIARATEAVLARALELAEIFWASEIVGDSMALDAIREGLRGSTLPSTANPDEVLEISGPGFVQLYVAHNYEGGVDVVEIGYQLDM